VTCDRDGQYKFLLAPAAVAGTQIKSADAGLDTSGLGGWVINLQFKSKGTSQFAAITKVMATKASGDPAKQFSITLDGLVVSAPEVNEPIVNGQAQISGSFTKKDAQDLADVLKYGALPLSFETGEVETVSPTLGSDQLHAGLLAGALGLLLVVLFSALYYRGLALVSVLSLAVAGALTYGLIVYLGVAIGFTLTLAGIAGTIVAIGITADSFVVFFERLRDEVREGRSLRAAVETGWVRARRTIIAADLVSILAAAVLYVVSIGAVRGFAFTLGLTTLVDLFVVFCFTKPMMTLLARTEFYGKGHPWSGLDPDRLGRRPVAPATAQEA
jgi:preprotein translocase subunit SecD